MSYIWIMCWTDAGLTCVFVQARLYVTISRFSDPRPEILMHFNSYVASCWRRKENTVSMKQAPSGRLYIVPSPLSLSGIMIRFVFFEFFKRREAGLGVGTYVLDFMISNSKFWLSDPILHFDPPQLTCGKLLTSGKQYAATTSMKVSPGKGSF